MGFVDVEHRSPSLEIYEQMPLVGQRAFGSVLRPIPNLIRHVVFPVNAVLTLKYNYLSNSFRLPRQRVEVFMADLVLDNCGDIDLGLAFAFEIWSKTFFDDVEQHPPHRDDIQRAEDYDEPSKHRYSRQ